MSRDHQMILSPEAAERVLTQEQHRLLEAEWQEARRVARDFPDFFAGVFK